MSTSVSSVVSHFPEAENGFTTTLASTISSGAATVPLNSLAGYTNGMPVVFVVDPTDASKKQTFTGIADTSGVQVTNVVWTAGTNQTHTGGATVVDYATATHISMISKGILGHADQDGTLKAGAVDVAAVLASDVVTTAKILDSNVTTAKIADTNVTNAKLATGAGQPGGAWTSYTTTLSGKFNDTKWTKTASYTRVGNKITGKIVLVANAATPMDGGGTDLTFTLPVTSVAITGTAGLLQIGTGYIFDASPATVYSSVVQIGSTTTGFIRALAMKSTLTLNTRQHDETNRR